MIGFPGLLVAPVLGVGAVICGVAQFAGGNRALGILQVMMGVFCGALGTYLTLIAGVGLDR